MKVRPGSPYPLGATWDGEGVNFALFSENATGVELCLFEGSKGNDELARVRVTETTDLVWHVYIPGLGPGPRYGYPVPGPHAPARGHTVHPATCAGTTSSSPTRAAPPTPTSPRTTGTAPPPCPSPWSSTRRRPWWAGTA